MKKALCLLGLLATLSLTACTTEKPSEVQAVYASGQSPKDCKFVEQITALDAFKLEAARVGGDVIYFPAVKKGDGRQNPVVNIYKCGHKPDPELFLYDIMSTVSLY